MKQTGMIDVTTYAAAKAYTDSHGGGGGTSNYNALSNKPQINGHILEGNMTSEQIGLTSLVGVYDKEHLTLS